MMFALLTFSQPYWLAVALVAALVLSLFVVLSYRHYWQALPMFGWAAAAKTTALILLALCLGDPLWSSSRARPGANQFWVVADDSQSLQLQDANSSMARGEELRELLINPETPWRLRLEQDFEVRRYLFGAAPKYISGFQALSFAGERSDLVSSLRSLKDRIGEQPVAGLLVFTDGNSTDGLPPATLTGLPPVYFVPIGAKSGFQDLAISNVNVTTTSFEDAPVTLNVELRCEGLAAGPIIVRVDDLEGKPVQHESKLYDPGSHPPAFRFQMKPTTPGLNFYRVRAGIGSQLADFEQSTASNEVTLDNNSQLVSVDRGTGPYRLLYVAGRPNWEFKFLRRSLAADEQLQLTAMVRIARKEAKFDFRGRDGESANPLFRGFGRTNDDTERYDQPVIVRLNTQSPEELREGFPRTAEELFQFHAVILDDVEAAFFTAEQMALLERFVSERGGGFLMLGGAESFREGRYSDTALARLLPVYFNAPPQLPPPQGFRLSLTREGWLQPWARLRKTEGEEATQLRERAPLRVLNTVSGVKPGGAVIAEITDPQGRKYPALVEQRYGRGRAVALLGGDLWRNQLEASDSQRHLDDLGKSWRQMLRWLVVDVPTRIDLRPVEITEAGASLVRLEARIRDQEYRPQDNSSVNFTINPPVGAAFTVPGEPSLREPGLYEATLSNRPDGAWRVKATVKDADGVDTGTAENGWTTNSLARELRRVQPDRSRLTELAAATGGQVVELSELPQFVRSLPDRAAPVTELSLTPLWDHPLVWLAIITAFCFDWGVRRRHGLP